MRIGGLGAVVLAAMAAPAAAQMQQDPARTPVAQPPAPAEQVLREGTAIQLVTRNDLSSKTAKGGDHVELAVAEPVVVDGVTVIPAGAPAVGTVAKARDNGLLGRSGKLEIEVSEVKAGDRPVAVRGERDSKGKGGTVGAVGAGVVFLPLALVVKGKEARIPAGTKVEVFVDKDVALAVSDGPGGGPAG